MNSAGKKLIVFAIIMISIICSCDATDQNEPWADVKQIPGCIETNLDNDLLDLNCFEYDFENTLHVELCLTANCYPDSERFAYSVVGYADTISVTVTDTSSNSANCICPYRIEMEFINFENDTYVFECHYQDSTYYSEIVTRNSAL